MSQRSETWFCPMGHSGDSDYALQATMADLVILYGSLREFSRTGKSVLIYELWAIAQDLVMSNRR
jgi:hypothetical protein